MRPRAKGIITKDIPEAEVFATVLPDDDDSRTLVDPLSDQSIGVPSDAV
jgi:hypothetical protein